MDEQQHNEEIDQDWERREEEGYRPLVVRDYGLEKLHEVGMSYRDFI